MKGADNMDELMNRKCIAVQIVKDKEVETEDEVKERQALREEIRNIKYRIFWLKQILIFHYAESPKRNIVKCHLM